MCATRILKTERNHLHDLMRRGVNVNQAYVSELSRKIELQEGEVQAQRSAVPVKKAALQAIKRPVLIHAQSKLPNDLARHIYSYLPLKERYRLAGVNYLFYSNHLPSYMNDLHHSTVFDHETAYRCAQPFRCEVLDILKLQQTRLTHFRVLSGYIPRSRQSELVDQDTPNGPTARPTTQAEMMLATQLMMHRANHLRKNFVRRMMNWFVMNDLAPLMGRITTFEVVCSTEVSLTNDQIATIVKRCQNLERLYITNERSLTDGAGMAIGEHCQHLIALKLTNNKISNLSLTRIAQQRGRNLKSLDVNCCDRITDSSIKALTTCCPNLIHLDIRGTSITPPAIETFVKAQPVLEHLSITQGSPNLITLLALFCPSLREFHVTHMQDQTDFYEPLGMLLSNCQKLEALTFPLYAIPSDPASTFNGFKDHPSLKTLNVSLMLTLPVDSIDPIRMLKLALPPRHRFIFTEARELNIFRMLREWETPITCDMVHLNVDWDYVPCVKQAEWTKKYQDALRDIEHFPTYESLREIVLPFRNLVSSQLSPQNVNLFWDSMSHLLSIMKSQSLWNDDFGEECHRILHDIIRTRAILKVPPTCLFDALYLSKIL